MDKRLLRKIIGFLFLSAVLLAGAASVLFIWPAAQEVDKPEDQPLSISPVQVAPLSNDGVTVSGNVKISVTAEDDEELSKVEFYSANGGYLIETKKSPPYTVKWVTDPWVPNGEQILKVVAYDKLSHKTTVTRKVFVQNNKEAPSAPSHLRLTGKTDQTLTLAWDASTGKSGVAEYEIYNGLVRMATSTSNHITLKNLNPGRTFKLAVKARDREWNFSGASNTIKAATEPSRDTIPPAAPSVLTVISATDTTLELKWTGSKDNYDNISANLTYNIYNGSELLAHTSGTRTTVKKLHPNTAYTLTVKARDAAGNLSKASKPVEASTRPLDKAAPAAPANLRSPEQTNQMVYLKWDVPADQYGVKSYSIYRNNVKIMDTTSPNFVVSGLRPNTRYTFYVTAMDASGNMSPPSRKLTVSTGSSSLSSTPPRHVIAGYYAAWATYRGSEVYDLDASKLTVLNYAFANIGDDLKLHVGDPYADIQKEFPGDSPKDAFKGNFNQLKKLKKLYPHLKTVISVGGWGWSQKFSDAALTESSRTVFADSVVQFLVSYGFNGVDFDWEYPVGGGSKENVQRPVDSRNYTLLLQKVREKLDARQELDGKKYTISIAAGASANFAKNTQLDQISRCVDYIQLMTYDYTGSWDSLTGFNAPLHAGPAGIPHAPSVSQAVQMFLDKGVPASKLVLGIPFYGYEFQAVQEVNRAGNGLHQPHLGPVYSHSFGDIEKDFLHKSGFTRFWDPVSKVPYLWNGTTFVSYDDAHSIAQKSALIKSKGLAGAMIWELSQDPGEILLDQLASDLK